MSYALDYLALSTAVSGSDDIVKQDSSGQDCVYKPAVFLCQALNFLQFIILSVSNRNQNDLFPLNLPHSQKPKHNRQHV